jgi:uncharacterized protein YcaQ
MNKIKIPIDRVREFILHQQTLHGSIPKSDGLNNTLKIIQSLGYVQIDTLSVTQRAHHHIIWTRNPNYDPDHLDQLLTQNRQVFEYWSHALSYLPLKDYRFYRYKMIRFNDPYSKWEKDRFENYGHLMKPVLDQIKHNGPMRAHDFLTPKSTGKQSPRDRNPFKVALEMLFFRGDIMIARREKFQRYFDLTEHILPSWVDTRMPTPGECAQFNILKALEVNGVARKQELFFMFQTMQKPDLDQAFYNLVDLGEILPVEIKGLNRTKYFVLKKNIELINQLLLSDTSNKIFILSPFDNFIIDRIRMKKLYDFEYALECYLPVTKRKYGYFVMPLLWKGKLIGRLDPKADRKNKVLKIHRIIFEDNFDDFNKIQGPLLEALKHFALFNECDHIHVKEIIPGNQNKLLKAKIDVTS